MYYVLTNAYASAAQVDQASLRNTSLLGFRVVPLLQLPLYCIKVQAVPFRRGARGSCGAEHACGREEPSKSRGRIS